MEYLPSIKHGQFDATQKDEQKHHDNCPCMKSTRRGPYMNDDGDWWVPIGDVGTFQDARKMVVDCLSYEIPEDGTLRYLGKSKTLVCDKHTADEIGPCCNSTCSRIVLCYHFLENRKW